MVGLTTSGDYVLHVEDWVIRPITQPDGFDFSDDDQDSWSGDDMMGSSG